MRPDDQTAHDAALLAAYCDGVTELTSEERKRVEALLVDDPAARTDETETRTLLASLRELPPAGDEPDWAAMERAIGNRVGTTVPRPWWRPAWRFLVPLTALAVTAAAAIIYLRTSESIPSDRPDAPTVAAIDAGVADPIVDDDPAIALWLDGAELVVDETADDMLRVDDMLLGRDDRMVEGLLPVGDLAWVDDLDDEDIAAAEELLADDTLTRKRKKG